MKYSILLSCLLCLSFSLHAQWERVLDANGGQINTLARTPNGRLWAGTGTGLFESSDEGNTWTRNASVAPTWNVKASRIINGTLYLLAAHPMGNNTSRVLLHEIAANGSSQTQVVTVSQYTDWGNSAIFTANNFLYVQAYNILMRRPISGSNNWTSVPVAGFSLVSVSGDGSLLAAVSGNNFPAPSQAFLSLNGGNWQLAVLPGASTTEWVVATFVRGNRVLVAYGNGDLFVSNNAGSTWTKTKLPFNISYNNVRFRWDETLDRLTACIENWFYTSPDGGSTWQSAGSVSGNEVQDFLPEGERTSVGGKIGFAQRGTAAGAFALRNTGLRTAPTRSIKTFGSETIALFSTGLYRSQDNGSTWSQDNIPLLAAPGFREILDFEKSGNRIYLLTNEGLMMSTDNGATWPATYTTTTSGTSLQFGAAGELWVIGHNDVVTVVSMTDPAQVIRTFSTLLTPGTNDYLYTLHYDPWDGNILGFLPENGNVYASANKGKNWEVRANLPGIQNFAGSFYQASGTAGRLFFMTNNIIFYSTDHGFTWTKATVPSSTGGIEEMVESGGNLFATTTFEGILRSINNGTNWSFAFNNATDIRLQGLAPVTASGGVPSVLVGSDVRGIWRYQNISTNPFQLVSGKTTVCPGGAETYCIAPLPLASKYTWQLPTSSGINGQLLNPVVLDGATGNCAEVFFGTQAGNSAISVTYDGDIWPVPVTFGFAISIKAIPPTTLPTITLAYEDLPYTWPVSGDVATLNPGATQMLSTTLTSYRGCDSLVRQNITVKPPVAGTVLGSVFWDKNNNGTFNTNTDIWAAGIVVRTSSGLLTNTDGNGKYSLKVLSPGDTIWAVPTMPNTAVFPAFSIYQAGGWSHNFRFFKTSSTPDLWVDLTNEAFFRSGFDTKIRLTCRNIGLQTAQNVQVKLFLPAFLEVKTVIPAASSHIGDTLVWDLGPLAFNEARTIMVVVKTPANIPLNTPVLLSATVLPTAGDANPQDNTTRLSSWVRNSFDPNNKQVSPAYATPAMLANGDRFEYTVRFQNTGNFPADFVRITDTLGSTVDASTFRLIASSHPCTWKMLGKGVVEFFFENIQLPDSTSDEPGSHGFVKFSLKPRPGLPLGTRVENTADIFFDFNPPVRTNTAQTQVVYFLPGQEPGGDELSLRPNPAAFRAFCAWENPLQERGLLRLYDLKGLPQREMWVEIGETEVSFDVMGMPAGAYLAVLEAGQVFLVKTLVVIPAGGLSPSGE